MARDRPLPSLRVVLTAAVALPLGGGLVLVGAGLTVQARSIVEHVSASQHLAVGQRVRAELLPTLTVPHWLNAANAQLLRTAGPLGDDELRRHLYRQLRDAPGVGYVQVGYAADGGFVGVERTDDGGWRAEVSDPARSGKSVWTLDDRGDPSGARLSFVDGYDARTRPWYRAALAADAPAWSPVYQFSSKAAPRLGITAVEPLRSLEGELIGVVGADLVLSQLSEHLGGLARTAGASIALVERDGTLVATSGGPPFRVGPDGVAARLAATEAGDPLLSAAVSALDGAGGLAGLGEEQILRTGDPDALIYASPFRDGRNLDWVVLVAVPADRAVGPLERDLRVALLLGLALLGAAATGAVVLAQRLTRPLRDVSEAAEALARRRWDHPLPGSPVTREIEALIRGFAAMRAELQVTLEDAELARREAEDANRAKSGFLAGISHELRTPLTAILGYSDLLLEDPELAAATRQDLDRIRRSAANLLQLINDLLDLARVEAGRMALEVEALDPGELALEVATALRPLVEAGGNRLVLELEPGAPPLWTDRGRLRQILINLVGNAAKFTDDGVITLRVARRAGEHVFEVQDTGVGMPPELVPTLFRPYERAPGSERRIGTGLGLAIVARLLEALGGRVSVDSAPGRGSRFTVTLASDTPGLRRAAGREPEGP